MNDALDDWLAHGLDGMSARTVTLYKDTIAPALREQAGTMKLRDLTASDVQGALTALASRMSTRTVQISHNVLARAIRHAERDGLVIRNVAALVKPPKGQRAGRPSKALTLEQAIALMDAAKGTRLEAYITLSLLTGLRTEEARALRWTTRPLLRIRRLGVQAPPSAPRSAPFGLLAGAWRCLELSDQEPCRVGDVVAAAMVVEVVVAVEVTAAGLLVAEPQVERGARGLSSVTPSPSWR